MAVHARIRWLVNLPRERNLQCMYRNLYLVPVLTDCRLRCSLEGYVLHSLEETYGTAEWRYLKPKTCAPCGTRSVSQDLNSHTSFFSIFCIAQIHLTKRQIAFLPYHLIGLCLSFCLICERIYFGENTPVSVVVVRDVQHSNGNSLAPSKTL